MGEYHYEITNDGYLPAEGTIAIASGANAPAPITLGKTVNCTFTVTAYGSPLADVKVVYGGWEGRTGSHGKITVPMNAKDNYQISLESSGYETKTVSGEAAVTDFSLADVDMGYKSVNKTLSVKYQDAALTGATVSFEAVDGEKITASESNGVYSAILKIGKTYTATGACAGFTVTGTTYTVAEDNACPDLSAAPADLAIQADKSSITFNGEATEKVSAHISQGQISQSGFQYVWSSSDISVLTIENGVATAHKRGSADIILECHYNGNVVQRAATTITVNPGEAQNFGVGLTSQDTTDQSAVKFSVGGIVEKGTITMKAVGGNLPDGGVTETWNVETSTDSVEWKADSLKDDDTYLKGEITYTFTYHCESNNFNDKTTNPIGQTYYVSQALEGEIEYETEDGSWKEAKDIVYGDNRTLKILPADGTTEETSKLRYAVSDPEVLSVDPDGNVTVNNAGTAEITVTREKDDQNYWDEASCTIKVTVEQKELDPLDAVITEFKQDDNNRVYNQKKNIEVTGEVAVNDEKGLEQADEGKITVKATVELPSADADTYTASADTIVVTSWTLQGEEAYVGNYKLPDLKKMSDEDKRLSVGSYTVAPKEIYIEVSDASGKHEGTLNYGQMNAASKLTPKNMVITVNGVIDNEKEQFDRNTTEKLSLIPIEGVKDIGTHTGALQVDTDKANELIAENGREKKNYTFPATGHTWADLIVEQEAISDNDLSRIVEYAGTGVYTSEDYTAWIKSEGGKLFVNIKNGTEYSFEDRYDSVLFDNEGITVNLTKDGITSEKLADLDELNVRFALKDGDSYKNESKSFDLIFKLDDQAPKVKYQSELVETVPVTDGFLKSISFGTFDRAIYEAKFTVTDDQAGFAAKDNGVYVWKLSEDELSEEGIVTEETISNKVANLSADKWESFSEDDSVTADGTYSVQVAVDQTGQADAIAGNYIVLVKTEDKVGNSTVYASNGIVIDVSEPNITVTFEGGKKAYYGGDIEYNITVTENPGILGVSGVAEVVWEVFCDGKKVENNNSGSVNLNSKEQYSVTELQETYSTDNVIKSSDCNSNDIQLVVTAKDRAGNPVDSETYNLIIDTTAPKIKVEYDNVDVKNNIYFDAKRIATVTFTERNFDKAKATFDLSLEDGTAYKNLTLEELDKIAGIDAGWGEDSQADIDEKKYTDDRTNTAVITFAGDNHYSNFVPHCVDKAGNESKDDDIEYPESKNTEYTTREFVIDTKAPVIKAVKYTADSSEIKVGKTESGRIYKNKTIDAVIVIDEHNFALPDANGNLNQFADGQVNYSVAATKVGQNQTIPDYNAQANETGYWTSNGDTRTSNAFVYNNDANYTTSFEYTDLAGHKAVWSEEYFTVDKTAPTGSVKVGTRNVVTQFLNSITFYLYSKTPISVSFTGADHTSPIQPLVYYKAYTPMNIDQVAAIKDWTQGNSFSVNPDSQVVPYLKVVDYAGNVAYFSSNEITIADDTAPLNKDTSKPLIAITTSQPPHDICNGNVSFAIHAEDPVAGNTYSGLATVKYEILNNNVVTQSHTYNYASNTNRTRTMDTNEVVTAALNNSNHVRIKVTATDNAGNVSEEIKDIKIDITKPKISVTFDNNSPLNGKYFKDTRTATVTVTERNFDPNNVQINVTNTHGTQASISGWSHSAGAGESDSATHTTTITFSADGDYTFTVDCTDLAMNKAENPYKSDEFTIDKTIPTISVSYDNDSAQNGNYYKATRTATITITEHNFSARDVRVTTTASNGSAPGVSGWSSSGDRHTATVYFGSDADYTFDIEYTDLAGNSAADYSQDKFTVDLTKPTLEITGVANKSANKGTVAPVIKINDTNFIASGVILTLTGANKGKVNTANMVTRSNDTNGQTITFLNFGSKMDDIYTLTAKVVDKAGNETTKSITFSVNRDGSTYVVNDATKKLIENGFTNNPQDIVIQEINVDTLEFIEISYSKNGTIVKLTEGTDYTVKVEGGEGQWKKYTYTIFASCFEEEGEYSINISSTDRAENISNNKVQSVNVDFVVDKTAPTMAVSNLENRGRYKESRHEYTLNIKDNAMLVSLEIYLDDELYKTYKLVDGKLVNVDDASDVLEMDNGKVYLSVDSKNSYQKIKLVSTDAAGNVAETEEYNVLVTTSNWVQFYANKPLFFGSIAAIVVICGLIFFIIWKRKKDEEQQGTRRV